jgi:molecular chaperone GrpE (heat shock protein)
MKNINDIEVNNPEFLTKQTAVEFLHSEYKKIIGDTQVTFSQMLKITDALEQAKEIEKQQIIDADINGSFRTAEALDRKISSFGVKELAQEYYEKTFNKG